MHDYKLEHICSYTGRLASPAEVIGPLPEGIRVNFYSTGGEITGPHLRGNSLDLRNPRWRVDPGHISGHCRFRSRWARHVSPGRVAAGREASNVTPLCDQSCRVRLVEPTVLRRSRRVPHGRQRGEIRRVRGPLNARAMRTSSEPELLSPGPGSPWSGTVPAAGVARYRRFGRRPENPRVVMRLLLSLRARLTS
jgi:hypothetical protein